MYKLYYYVMNSFHVIGPKHMWDKKKGAIKCVVIALNVINMYHSQLYKRCNL